MAGEPDYITLYKQGKMSEKECINWFLFATPYHNNIKETHKILPYNNDSKYLIETYDRGLMVVDTSRELHPRKNKEYNQWRTKVFERDSYTCKHCGQVGGKLNAHHIKHFAKYKKLRYVVSNGITLCEKCHRKEHKKK